jgi:predicted AlkP superfamily phosphohydrolase/phosphomutase
MMAGPEVRKAGRQEGMRIVDVAPTVLNLMGIEVPGDMEGRVIR